MRLVCMSDTHGQHRDIANIPEGDVLIIAGDYSAFGTKKEIIDINSWLGTLSHQYKLVTSGNHDKYAFMHGPEEVKNLFTNATYLEDEGIVINNVRFYLSPWIVKIAHWYYMLPRGSAAIKEKWSNIPSDTDVLVTHMPPAYILDYVYYSQNNVGCEDLRNEVKRRIKPRVHVFGHIHESYGGTVRQDTTFINASICTREYKPTNLPILIDI